MTASLQTPEDGLNHQYDRIFGEGGGLRPEWGTPHELSSSHELMKPYLEMVPKPLRPLYQVPQPIGTWIRSTDYARHV